MYAFFYFSFSFFFFFFCYFSIWKYVLLHLRPEDVAMVQEQQWLKGPKRASSVLPQLRQRARVPRTVVSPGDDTTMAFHLSCPPLFSHSLTHTLSVTSQIQRYHKKYNIPGSRTANPSSGCIRGCRGLLSGRRVSRNRSLSGLQWS